MQAEEGAVLPLRALVLPCVRRALPEACGLDSSMPYSDPDKQREYMRQWLADRRAAFFAGKICAQCGSIEDLQLDHKDPAKKVSHRIWSWSEARRLIELDKCQVLCHTCHEKKSATEKAKSEKHGSALLKAEDIPVIRASSEPRKVLAARYGVSPETIKTVRAGRSWRV